MITHLKRAEVVRSMASSPEQLMELFSQRLRERDLEGLVELYEPEAVFFTAAGQQLSGRAGLRHALSDLFALEPLVTMRVAQVLSAEATALVVSDWSMRCVAGDGSMIRDGGSSASVLRRQPDGGWLILIDHP